MGTFSLVSMMREDNDTVERFVNYYRSQGVEKIYIYFDGSIGHLNIMSGDDVEIVECNQEFWQPIFGGRPADISKAQEFVYRQSLSRCKSDWLLITDADEYIFGDRKIPQILDVIPENLDVFVIQSAEAIWGPGDLIDRAFGSHYFRTAISNKLLWHTIGFLIYGKNYKLFNSGILSHALGKHFIRSNREYEWIGNHNSKRGGRNIGRWAHSISPDLKNMFVGHFDAICFNRWRDKWHLRLTGETNIVKMGYRRRQQMEMIKNAANQGQNAEFELFKKFYCLNNFQYFLLKLFGKSFRRDIFDTRTESLPAGKS